MVYRAPVEAMQFTLFQLAGLADIATLPAFADVVSHGLVHDILADAAQFAERRMVPLNPVGDCHGCRFRNGKVITPPGFQQTYRQFIDNGWIGLDLPRKYGGRSLPGLLALAVDEMWCSANLAFSLCPLLTSVVSDVLYQHADEAVKQRYLPQLANGQWSAALALTEAQASYDFSTVAARAVPTAQGSYRLFGQKIFVAWGEHDLSENIVHLVLARLADASSGNGNLALFVVPKYLPDSAGHLNQVNDLRCLSIEHKLGIHASPTCLMAYGEREGALGYLVAQTQQAVMPMLTMMNDVCLKVAIEGVAVAECAYQYAVHYARRRVQGNTNKAMPVAIIEHPDVRRMLITMRAHIEAQRALSYLAAAAMDKARHHPDEAQRCYYQARVNLLAPIVKAYNADQVNQITSLAIQVYGGRGFIEASGVAQYYRDARIMAIDEVNNGIQAIDLLRSEIIGDAGVSVQQLANEITTTVDLLKAAQLESLAQPLAKALQMTRRCIDYMLTQFPEYSEQVSVGAWPLLRLMAITLGAWQLCQAVLVASSMPSAFGAPQRLMIARFFSEHILPHSDVLAKRVLYGAPSVLDLPVEIF